MKSVEIAPQLIMMAYIFILNSLVNGSQYTEALMLV